MQSHTFKVIKQKGYQVIYTNKEIFLNLEKIPDIDWTWIWEIFLTPLSLSLSLSPRKVTLCGMKKIKTSFFNIYFGTIKEETNQIYKISDC